MPDFSYARPESFEQALRAATALHEAGQVAPAAERYAALAAQEPANPQLLYLLGAAHAQLGHAEEAERSLRTAIQLAPAFAPASLVLATLLASREDFADAETVLRRCLDASPDHAKALHLLGNVLHRQSRFGEAEAVYRRAMTSNPVNGAIPVHLAHMLIDQDRFDEAEAELRAVLARLPDDAGALTALGRVLEKRGALEEALALHDQALARDPRNEGAAINRGNVKRFLGDYTGALADYDAALAVAPGNAPAIASRGLALLTLGRLAEGWPGYRARKSARGTRDFSGGKIWQGEPLDGKRVLVWTEYGLGDEILFAGLLSELAARTSKCTVVCTPRLSALFRRSFPDITVVSADEFQPTEDFDVRLPLTDAAQLLRPTMAAFPKRAGYLKADTALRETLRARYRRNDRNRLVGISWRSAATDNGIFKSVPLSRWEKILATPGVTFVSLQYGASEADVEQVRAANNADIVVDPEISTAGDLDGFAAQVDAMDLVISVSNTTVHFAGALDKPVWVLTPTGKGALWYWFLERDDSPWYPQARLFRQHRRGDWDNALAQVAEQLGQGTGS